ncbi:agamous-like MADS-box protein AGL97 [Raphanus sativus]|uniref:Agamous-like MADS-box protein AGL97 n=1 Tax=Raphanus sativus TaxID=3726 RepID=A0A6J0JI88_RAPSA|nr:agamous-like MADS-box protein AGL97 [Raphanus sativus]
MVKPQKKPKVERRKRKTTRRVLPPRRPAANFRGILSDAEKKKRIEELRDDLFSEAAKLVAEDPSQSIAILMVPRSNNSGSSGVGLQSFGYPSVESVVGKFLKDTAPPVVPVVAEEDAKEKEEEEDDDEDWSKYYWWEDEKLLNSKDPEEIMAAMAEMEKLRKQIEIFESEIGEGSGTQEDDDDDGSKP